MSSPKVPYPYPNLSIGTKQVVGWTGVDYSATVAATSKISSSGISAKRVDSAATSSTTAIPWAQDYITFTFDDFEGGGGDNGPYGASCCI